MSTYANRYINCSRTMKKVNALKFNGFSCVFMSNFDKLTTTSTMCSEPTPTIPGMPGRFLYGYKPLEATSSTNSALNFKAGHKQRWTKAELHSQSQRRNYSTHRHRKPLFKKKEHNFYDVLGVTPKATQAQIKAAYYKLSKIYHPDKVQNVDDQDKTTLAESQAKFNEITEAYNVLGNPLMRRRYDRGILSPHDTAESVKKQEAASRTDNQVYRPATDKRIYDFDAFYERHYGQSIARERQARADRMEREAAYAKQMAEGDKYSWLPMSMILFGVLGGLVYLYENKYNDGWKKVLSDKKY